jgi:hypothetical protein
MLQMSVPWLRLLVAGLSLRRPRFEFGSIYVGFLVDKVSLGQVLLRGFDFLLSISFHCGPPRSHITWGMNTRSVGSCSSETLCHPIDMNNTDANHFFSSSFKCSLYQRLWYKSCRSYLNLYFMPQTTLSNNGTSVEETGEFIWYLLDASLH